VIELEQADRTETENTDRTETENTDRTETKNTDRLEQRTKWSNWSVLAVIIVCFFVIIQFGQFNTRHAQRHHGVGKTLPRLKLQPLSGNGPSVTLADLTGRVVLISFWGTWDPKCEEQLAQMAKIEKEFRDQPAFRLLTVSCQQGMKENLGELREITKEMLRRRHSHMPTYTDRGRVSRSTVDRVVGSSSLPTTLILDRTGRIRGVWTGLHDGVEKQIEDLITRLLKEV
jgi:peroxiredoxin